MTYKAFEKLCEGDDNDTLERIIGINERCKCWKYIKGKINFIITFSIIALIIDIFSLYLSFILKPKNEYLKKNYFRKLDDDLNDFLESSTIQSKKKYFFEISNYQIGISFTNIIFTIVLLILVFMQKCKYNENIIRREKKQGRKTEAFILIYFIFYVVFTFLVVFLSLYTFFSSVILLYSIKDYSIPIENLIISDYALVLLLITLLLIMNVLLHFLISRRFEEIIVLLLDLNIKEENALDNDKDNKEKSGYLYIVGTKLTVQIKYNSNIYLEEHNSGYCLFLRKFF